MITILFLVAVITQITSFSMDKLLAAIIFDILIIISIMMVYIPG